MCLYICILCDLLIFIEWFWSLTILTFLTLGHRVAIFLRQTTAVFQQKTLPPSIISTSIWTKLPSSINLRWWGHLPLLSTPHAIANAWEMATDVPFHQATKPSSPLANSRAASRSRMFRSNFWYEKYHPFCQYMSNQRGTPKNQSANQLLLILHHPKWPYTKKSWEWLMARRLPPESESRHVWIPMGSHLSPPGRSCHGSSSLDQEHREVVTSRQGWLWLAPWMPNCLMGADGVGLNKIWTKNSVIIHTSNTSYIYIYTY